MKFSDWMSLAAILISITSIMLTNHRRKQQVIYYIVDSQEAPTEPMKRGMWIISQGNK